ncbi:MAG: DUF177 domain-containing protein [Firmicutes bacterium]|nr:DUF177 domain-containing protein [Bacillota bacterium]
MRIYVGELKREVGLRESHSFVYEVPPAAEHGDLAMFDGPVKVETTLTNAGKGIIAEGRVEGVARLRCSRCLEEFTSPVSAEFKVEFREGAGLETVDDDEDVVRYSGDYVNLGEEIRQNLILSLPMKPLCDQACKGLCAQCGANLNEGECSCERRPVDPRLAGLEELQARLRGRGGES